MLKVFISIIFCCEVFIYPKFNKGLALVQNRLLSHLKQNILSVYQKAQLNNTR